ncbi:hypothetical protein KAR91_20690 [Candidatus Pacearchaeota archaeon]|nr:hypothetical protein [Candidatus Pacearchaeota archaeon]
MRIFIGSKSFGKYDSKARQLLVEKGVEVVNTIEEAEGIIAGTEPYTPKTLSSADKVRVIVRMGVGYDNVDLDYCEKRGIIVAYTPDAPSGSVADLIVAQILNMTRHIPEVSSSVKRGDWNKPLGKKVSELIIGVMGVGRIGKKVINRLQPFEPKQVIAYDTDHVMLDKFWGSSRNDFIVTMNRDYLLSECDVITVSIPMNEYNDKIINYEFIHNMRWGSYLINTSRGGILNEEALVFFLNNYPNKLAGVALDVFDTEPYEGPLLEFDNVILTPHIGSTTLTARVNMGVGSIVECINILEGNAPFNEIPKIGEII